MAVQQGDIIDGNIVFTNLDPYKINPGSELEGATTATAYAIGSSGTIPLQVKATGASNTGWNDEQDISLYGVSITTSTPIFSVGATVTSQLVTLSITTGTLVGLYGAGAWATSAGTLSQTKEGMAGFGSQNATLVAGGDDDSSTYFNTTELFNGSTWVTSGNISTSKTSPGGGGSQNAGWAAGGITSVTAVSNTELFNGVTWTASGNLTQSKGTTGFGSQNAGIAAGGSASVVYSTTELFNGATWVASVALSQSRAGHAGIGSQNAGLIVGGTISTPSTSNSFLWNGATWNASGNISQTKVTTGAGSQNSGLIVAGGTGNGGGAGNSSITELFNGTNWIVSGNSSQSKNNPAVSGSQSAGLVAGGGNGPFNTTELHTQSLYRALTWEALRCASNIGVATNISGNTCNVRLQGFVQNMSISAASDSLLVVTRNSSNTTSTAVFQVFKTVPDADDWIVGKTVTVTTSLRVSNNPVLTFDEVKNWG